MGTTEPPIQWVTTFSLGRNRITKLNSHFHLVARISVSGAIPLLSYIH